jgi:hypothetical protein
VVSWAIKEAGAGGTRKMVIIRTILKNMKSLGISNQIIYENLAYECVHAATHYYMLSVLNFKNIQIISRFLLLIDT